MIVANGVYGFGIDDRAGLGAAFAAARAVLRPGGTMVLGWNDVPALAPFDPEAVADEAGFERALKSGEIPMGQYFHDVTGLAAADGFPIRSTFPQEGGVLNSGF